MKMEIYDTTREGAIILGMPEEERSAWWWIAKLYPCADDMYTKMREWGF